MNRNLQLLFNVSEITAGTRGASLGPQAIVTAARKAQDDFFSDYPPLILPDFNASLDAPVKYPSAKRIEFLSMLMDELVEAIDQTIEEGKFPFIVAGDHGSAAGTIAGIKKNYADKRLGVVWIDAHGDLHTPFTTPTGNMHGMPLAIALQEDNKECLKNEVPTEVEALWNELKNKGTNAPKFDEKDLLFFGVRSTEPEENELIHRKGIRNFPVPQWRKMSAEKRKEALDNFVDQIDVLYVSFDVDSMDPELTSYGTGTPVRNGFSPKEAEELLHYFAAQEKLVGMEFVEVNPCLDNQGNKMAEITFDLLKSTFKKLA